MAMMAVDKNATFLDTNVLVSASAATAPFHQATLAWMREISETGGTFWISRQILREYLAVLSRPQPYSPPLAVATLLGDVARFQASFGMVEDGPSVTVELLNLLSTIPCGGKQVHDANIVATMLAHGITRVLTHNTSDFVRFAGVVTVLAI